MVEAISPTLQEEPTNDEALWAEVLKIKLDGVMYHISMMEQCALHGLEGYADLHKEHAIEEFKTYLHIAKDYVEEYKKVVQLSNIAAPIVKIGGATMEEKMEEGLNAYEDWEKQTYNRLKSHHQRITEHKDEMCYLLDDVKDELYCIRRMQDDLMNKKHNELNTWLQKKFGEA